MQSDVAVNDAASVPVIVNEATFNVPPPVFVSVMGCVTPTAVIARAANASDVAERLAMVNI